MGNVHINFITRFLLGLTLLLSVLAAISTYTARAKEEGRRPAKNCRYPSYPMNAFFGYYPLLAILLFVTLLLHPEPDLSILPSLIIMGTFQCVLLVLQPLLRKVIAARTCAALWTLLSVTLLFLTRIVRMAYVSLLTIPIPFNISSSHLPGLLYIWLAGFTGIMIWHIITHVLFRKKILKDIREADSSIMHVWFKEEAIANIPVGSYQVVISPAAQTPLSIGLFRRSTLVVLPEKKYTEEELKLILRHELIHICRQDALGKFGILFLTALFWFNPLMWIAMRCCADDLELSCDETVLFGYERDIRHQYANLLLNTVADQRGFTTCLSASARALRYRLKNVIVPRKRLTGGILVGLMCFFLFFGCFFVDFSYNPGTIGEHVFQNQSADDFTLIDSVVVKESKQIVADSYEDIPELTEYLFQIPISKRMKDTELNWDADMGQFALVSPDYTYSLWLTDDILRVYDPVTADISYYSVDGTVDWTYLAELVSQ